MDGGLRIMSFNVRGTTLDAGTANAWEHRAAQNVALIQRHAPDVVCLQEASEGNLRTYREELPKYRQIEGPRYGNRRPHSFNAMLFHPRRLEQLDAGGFWLSETPNEYSRSWDSRVTRSANLVRFGIANLSFYLLNTHLDHKSWPARREGSKLIVRRVARVAERSGDASPVVVTGDFNCRPGSAAYRNFAEAGFVDTFLAAGNKDARSANTFHAFRGPRYIDVRLRLGPKRIDWILLRDPQGRFRVEGSRILHDRDERSDTFPSDHYPVIAQLALENPN